MPPHLAGRADELSALEELSDELKTGRAPRSAILLGPRGNGKTVLIDAFLQKLRQKRFKYGRKANIVNLSAADLQNMGKLYACFKGKPPSKLKTMRGNVGAEGFHAGGEIEFHNSAERLDFFSTVLAKRAKSRPFVLAIDEAHALDPQVGHCLLNAFQQVRRENKPVLLILAGTPGITRHLGTMESTFWERAMRVRIGLLDNEAARDALKRPLQEAGVEFDDVALDKVVEESQRYPYFLQLWGNALAKAIGGASRIEMEHVEKAREMVNAEQAPFYTTRCKELRELKLLKVAQGIAGKLPQGGRMAFDSIEEVISPALPQECNDVEAALDDLVGLGYIWEDDQGRYIAGIPSLMSYSLQYGRESDPPSNESGYQPDGPSM